MQRRGESGQKGGRGAGPNARKASTARVSNAELQEQVAVLMRELKEAREQQSATSEVLEVISSSSGELEMTSKTSEVALCCSRASFSSRMSTAPFFSAKEM